MECACLLPKQWPASCCGEEGDAETTRALQLFFFSLKTARLWLLARRLFDGMPAPVVFAPAAVVFWCFFCRPSVLGARQSTAGSPVSLRPEPRLPPPGAADRIVGV